jgi:hypothetical protein
MGWVVHAIGIEGIQNGQFFIYFNGKRYFGNSSRKLNKNVKIIVDKNTVFLVDCINFLIQCKMSGFGY